MKTVERLLTMFITVTLALSVVSVANPLFFIGGLSAYADEDEEDNDNSGSVGGSEDEEQDDNDVDEEEETHEDEQEQQIRENSKVKLLVKEGGVELEIHMEEGDIEPGTYDVTFSCTDPDINMTFAEALAVEEDGEADFETEISLEDGVYDGCQVSFETVDVSFESFSITGGHDDGKEQEEEDDEESEQEEEENETNLVQSIGSHSKVTLQADDEVELEVEVEEGDLEDGLYNVTFACSSPEVNEEFANALEVEDGEGEFDTDLSLSTGTYTGCEVNVDGLSAAFPSFTVVPEEEDGEEEEVVEEEQEEQESKIKLEVEDSGIEIEVELKGITMADGLYDVMFSCTEPAISENFTGAFEVEDAEGEFEAEISLANATYNGCQLTVQDIVITFDSFTVMGEVDEEVEEKRKEKRHSIVNSITGTEIHQRHLSSEPASPGEYQPGWSYSLVAAGTAEGDADILANAAVDVDLAVWKSNSAIILLDVIGGQVEIEDHSYTVAIGYALYSTHSDVLRINALVIDDATGDVLKMKMRGSAVAEDAEFPKETGTLELEFEGNSGPSKNELDGWELMLDGTVAAV